MVAPRQVRLYLVKLSSSFLFHPPFLQSCIILGWQSIGHDQKPCVLWRTMAHFKSDPADVQPRKNELHCHDIIWGKQGTPEDRKNMQRMGKTQELRPNFRFVSIFGYSIIPMETWETILT
jgi:hypothetical protein